MEGERGRSLVEQYNYDYYYGVEGEQFAFFRIPKILITDKRYKELTLAAKMLYGLMLERMSLSRKNKWLDEENRVYIVYSIEKVAEDLNCSPPTAVKAMAELDSVKGIGLIERKKRGQGNPDIIYVKNFTSLPEEDKVGSKDDEAEVCESQDSKYLNSKNSNSKETCQNKNEENLNSKNLNSKSLNSRNLNSTGFSPREQENVSQEFTNFDANNTKNNNTEYNNSNHINQSVEEQSGNASTMQMDQNDEATAYMQIIKENIDYDIMMSDKHWLDRDMFDELYELICDVVCVPRKIIRIAGEDYPYALVKGKFLKLNSSHLQYVMSCMHNNTTKVANIKAYLITALYNAPNTIGHYYTAEVNHDMFGVG